MESIGQADHLEAASFVCTFYRLCNAKLETEDHVLKVTLDDEAAKQLDGPWARGYNLKLVFRDEDLKQKEAVELVTLGSHRFHYLVQSAVRKGKFVKIALSDRALPKISLTASAGFRYYLVNSVLSYRPSLAVTFVFGFQGERRWEETNTFIVDRANGILSTLTWNKVFPFVQALSPLHINRLDKATLSLRRSYGLLEQAAVNWLANEDTDWTSKARQKLQTEKKELADYYEKRLCEEAMRSPEVEAHLRKIWQTRLKEQQERFAPKVFIRPLQFAFLAIPQLESVYLRTGNGGEEKVRFTTTPFQNVLTE